MDLTRAVDHYCERLGPGLLAEPANALSNLAFFAAAAFTWKKLRVAGLSQPSILALPVMIFLIGVGSTAFHTLAITATEILDVLFIALFIHWFVVCFLHHSAKLRWPLALLGIPGFIAFGKGMAMIFPPHAYNGSAPYFPALGGIVAMGAFAGVRAGVNALYYFAAAVLLAGSLTLRTQDMAWCGRWPLGTHWIWHCLNALVLSMAVLGLTRTVELIDSPSPPARESGRRRR